MSTNFQDLYKKVPRKRKIEIEKRVALELTAIQLSGVRSLVYSSHAPAWELRPDAPASTSQQTLSSSCSHAGAQKRYKKMRKYDALCLDPIPEYDSEAIRSLRDRYQISQAVLASLINTSTSAARQWETGNKHPSGPSQKLLYILSHKGLETLT